MRRTATSLLLLSCLALPAGAQEWRVGAQVGRIDYASAVSDAAQGSTLSLALSRSSPSDWFGASAGIPLQEEPFWAVAGAWKRWRMRSATGLGLEVTGHAFLQRDHVTRTDLPPLGVAEPARDGEGAGGEAGVLAYSTVGLAHAEVRGGVTAQASRVSGENSRTALPFADGSLMLSRGAIQAGPEAKVWLGDSTHGYVGAAAMAVAGPVQLWANGGRWVRGGTDDISWSLGGMLPLGDRFRIEAGYRSESYDPQYATRTSSSLTLGASFRVRGSTGVGAPVPAKYENGRALIRIRAKDVAGRPSIAGDFTDWKPQPMTAAGDTWTFTVPLQPGVYNYAFVDENGTWFVPSSVPGRRDDGMGGHVAVLVVS